jgi:UDP-3-O-[3-hydroxymyristoyl] glucosamine N-acyltransferase
MQDYTLDELAKRVGGQLRGDPDLRVTSASTLEEAVEGQITFLANPRYRRLLAKTRASAVFVAEAQPEPVAQIMTSDPYFAFAQAVILLHGHRQHPAPGISPRSSIDPSAQLGEGTQAHDFATVSAGARVGARCVLYPNTFIGPGTVVGDDCILYPGAVIYDGCRVGNRVIIQANAIVGEDGFGFATHQGVHHKIPHIGKVILEDDVEIGAGSAIERGTLTDTVIGRGSKVGDLVAIGHGVRLGPGCLLVAQVGIAGSTSLGHHCVLAGQVGIAGHLRIGDLVAVGAKSGVNRNLGSGQRVFGYPAFAQREAAAAYAAFKFLPDYRRRLQEMEERLARFESGTRDRKPEEDAPSA